MAREGARTWFVPSSRREAFSNDDAAACNSRFQYTVSPVDRLEGSEGPGGSPGLRMSLQASGERRSTSERALTNSGRRSSVAATP